MREGRQGSMRYGFVSKTSNTFSRYTPVSAYSVSNLNLIGDVEFCVSNKKTRVNKHRQRDLPFCDNCSE